MKKIRLTESELVSLIEKIVKEEQSSLVNETVESTTTENKEIDEEAAVHERRNSTNEFIGKPPL